MDANRMPSSVVRKLAACVIVSPKMYQVHKMMGAWRQVVSGASDELEVKTGLVAEPSLIHHELAKALSWEVWS
jgi:hypothetical protein